MDLNRTMLIVVDVRNSFCTSGGWVDHIGSDVAPDRAPIAPLNRLTPALRRHGVPALWLNWGNRPDLANLPAPCVRLVVAFQFLRMIRAGATRHAKKSTLPRVSRPST